MNKTLCLIPARGGSRRIRRKNLLPLAGKPLLAYSIEAAKEAGVFEEVVVSSDDEEILAVADTLGVSSDLRPEQLSGDAVRFVEVVNEYLLRPGVRDRFQNVSCLLPTCPFRTVDDVRNSFQMFVQQATEVFLVGVTEYNFPPQLALDLDEDGMTLSMWDPQTYAHTTRSQSLAKAYHPNGAIYLASVDGFLRAKTFFGQPILGYVMPPERSFDIDYPYQLKVAELMMRWVTVKD